MAYFSSGQPSDGYVLEVAGTKSGHVLIDRDDVTIRGVSVGNAPGRLVADGSQTALILMRSSDPLNVTLPYAALTIEDMVLDGNDAANIVNLVASTGGVGPQLLTLRRCRFVGWPITARAVAVGTGRLVLEDCTFDGDGIAVNLSGDAADCRLDLLRIRGGLGGLIVAESTSCPGLIVGRMDARAWYHAVAHCEVTTPTAFAASYVDVASHVEAHRGPGDVLRAMTTVGTFAVGLAADADVIRDLGLRPWDRVEIRSGHWTQVMRDGTLDVWRKPALWTPLGEAPRAELATVRRPTLARLGQLGGVTATRLGFLTGCTWRTPDGEVADPPILELSPRLDIVRRGSGGSDPRDVDVGGVHLTTEVVGATFADLILEMHWSDQFTGRGGGHIVRRFKFRGGQDMNITDQRYLEENNTYVDGVVIGAGFGGMYVSAGTSPIVRNVAFVGNGVHRQPGVSAGIFVDPAGSIDLRDPATRRVDVERAWAKGRRGVPLNGRNLFWQNIGVDVDYQ